MSREQRASLLTADLQRGNRRLLAVLHAILIRFESAQGVDHFVAACQMGAARVSMKLAVSGISQYDKAAQNREGNLENDDCDKMNESGQFFLYEPGYGPSGDTRQEDDKRIDDPLQQRHRDHVSVNDVRNFVSDNGFHRIFVKLVQKSGRHGDEERFFEGPVANAFTSCDS